MPKNQPQTSPPSHDEVLRAKDRQIETLIATLDRQGRLLEQLMAGGGLGRSPEVAPVVYGPTFADVWTWYLETLATVSWKGKAVSTMRWALAWFAPSVCFRRLTVDIDVDPRCQLRAPNDPAKTATAGPDILLASLGPAQWTEFRVWLATVAPDMGVTNRNLMLARAKVMLNRAVADEKIERNRIDKVKREPRKAKRRTKITDDYLERLRPFASALVWAYAVTICDAGTRPGETRLLLWNQADTAVHHVDEEADTETWEFELQPWQAKGKKKARPAFLTRRCLDAYGALQRLADNANIFGSPKDPGQPYSEVHLWRLFRDAADAAGLEAADGDGSVHAHDGRRSYASKLISAGNDISQVQELLGHEDIATTRIYVDVDRDDLRKAHRRLASAARLPPQRAPDSPDGENP